MAENTSAIKPLITDADTILLYDAKELMMANCAKTSKRLMKINMKMHIRKGGRRRGYAFIRDRGISCDSAHRISADL